MSNYQVKETPDVILVKELNKKYEDLKKEIAKVIVGQHEIIEQIDAVTADQLLDLASALFREETLNLTILGPVDDRKSFEKIFSL